MASPPLSLTTGEDAVANRTPLRQLAVEGCLDRPLSELFRSLATGEALRLHIPDATPPAMALMQALERRLHGLALWGYHLDSLLL